LNGLKTLKIQKKQKNKKKLFFIVLGYHINQSHQSQQSQQSHFKLENPVKHIHDRHVNK
jgi:hypothetical protein